MKILKLFKAIIPFLVNDIDSPLKLDELTFEKRTLRYKGEFVFQIHEYSFYKNEIVKIYTGQQISFDLCFNKSIFLFNDEYFDIDISQDELFQYSLEQPGFNELYLIIKIINQLEIDYKDIEINTLIINDELISKIENFVKTFSVLNFGYKVCLN